MALHSAIAVHHVQPAVALRPYFTAYYLLEVDTAPGVGVDDCIHPQWASMCFTDGTPPLTGIGGEPMRRRSRFLAAGPTSKAGTVRIERSRLWGVGIRPAGWARYVPAPAHSFANLCVDGLVEPAFARFAPLADAIFASEPDREAEAARIDHYLGSLLGLPVGNELQVHACHEALFDPNVSTVGELAARAGLPRHSLERLTRRTFGFGPKLLLRRQRFLRSLAQFMLDPSLRWIGAIDNQYHDQAQFVRDFRAFMGMSPREYASLPHPILQPNLRERIVDAGVLAVVEPATMARYAG